jgi:hypothetical protein
VGTFHVQDLDVGHVRFPRGGLEDAFEYFATTGRFLPRCRYVFPRKPIHTLRGELSLTGENFLMQADKNIGKEWLDAMKQCNDSFGGLSGPKRCSDCDAMQRCAHNQDEPLPVIQSSL